MSWIIKTLLSAIDNGKISLNDSDVNEYSNDFYKFSNIHDHDFAYFKSENKTNTIKFLRGQLTYKSCCRIYKCNKCDEKLTMQKRKYNTRIQCFLYNIDTCNEIIMNNLLK